MARTDFAQPQADRSATANARRRTDRAPAPRSRRRRTTRGRSPRRSSGPGAWMPSSLVQRIRIRQNAFWFEFEAGFRLWAPSYPAIAAEANRPISSCFLHPDAPGARESGAAVDFHLQVRRFLLWRLDGNGRRALKSLCGSAGCERLHRQRAVQASAFQTSALPASQPAEAARSARSLEPAQYRLPAAPRPTAADSRVRATASPLSKSSALSHALARSSR